MVGITRSKVILFIYIILILHILYILYLGVIYIYVQVYVFKGKSHNFGDHQPESNVPNYFDLQLSIWLVFIRYRYLEWECIRWDESSIFVTCYQKAYQQRLKVLITYLFQGVLFKVQKKAYHQLMDIFNICWQFVVRCLGIFLWEACFVFFQPSSFPQHGPRIKTASD